MVKREIGDFFEWAIPAQFLSEVEWESDEQEVYYEAEVIEVNALMQHLTEYRAGGEPHGGLVDFYSQVCEAEGWDMDIIRQVITDVNDEVESYRDKAWDDRDDDIEDAKTYYD
jgi:hypothetical protein